MKDKKECLIKTQKLRDRCVDSMAGDLMTNPIGFKKEKSTPMKYRFVKTIDILANDLDGAKEQLSEMNHIEHYADLTEDFAFPLKKTTSLTKEDLKQWEENNQCFICKTCGGFEFGTCLIDRHEHEVEK
jgi:hypothetical protein